MFAKSQLGTLATWSRSLRRSMRVKAPPLKDPLLGFCMIHGQPMPAVSFWAPVKRLNPKNPRNTFGRWSLHVVVPGRSKGCCLQWTFWSLRNGDFSAFNSRPLNWQVLIEVWQTVWSPSTWTQPNTSRTCLFQRVTELRLGPFGVPTSSWVGTCSEAAPLWKDILKG